MNNREKAKAVQKKFNQRLGIYYGVMAAGVVVAAIGLMTKINVLTRLGVVAFFAGLVILSWVDGYTGYAKHVMTAKVLMDEEMPEDVVNAGIELVKKQGGSLSALKSQTREFSHILYHLCQGIFTATAAGSYRCRYAGKYGGRCTEEPYRKRYYRCSRSNRETS